MADIRLFICFEIPGEIREQISVLQNRLKSCGQGVSWTNSSGIHLTLKFLGDVPQAKIAELKIAVRSAVKGIKPVSIRIAGSGVFPNQRRPRVLWVGVQEPTGELAKCQNAIELSLQKLGYEREDRAFSPHLTLGRVKSMDDMEAITRELTQQEIDFGEFTAKEIIIMKSDTRPSGAVYAPLFRIGL